MTDSREDRLLEAKKLAKERAKAWRKEAYAKAKERAKAQKEAFKNSPEARSARLFCGKKDGRNIKKPRRRRTRSSGRKSSGKSARMRRWPRPFRPSVRPSLGGCSPPAIRWDRPNCVSSKAANSHLGRRSLRITGKGRGLTHSHGFPSSASSCYILALVWDPDGRKVRYDVGKIPECDMGRRRYRL